MPQVPSVSIAPTPLPDNAGAPAPDNGARFEELAGYVARARGVGGVGWVVVYRAAAQGVDVGGLRYAVSCEMHSTVVGDATRASALESMRRPDNFCDECRDAVDALAAAAPVSSS